MLEIKSFIPENAETIAKWITDERTFWFWSAGRYNNYPLSAEDIVRYNQKNKIPERLSAFCVFDGEALIGYFTLRYPEKDDKSTVRLGFIIVDPNLRGKGYGKQMIIRAITFCLEDLKAKKVTLGVFENNNPALNCYLSCGMKPNGKSEKYNCMGEEWNCIDLEAEDKKR